MVATILPKSGVRLSFREHDADHGKPAAIGAMREMRLHRKTLAADQMFARPVKMHLQQFVGRVAELQR
jgi:hypothetical protein